MAEIDFSVLKSACYYTDLFIKHKKDKSVEAIYYCDNADRVFKEPRCERYCEESKCPLLVNKI